MTRWHLAIFTLALCSVTPVWAHDGNSIVYDQVDLNATAEQEVQNDLLIGTLYTEHEGKRQAEVADRINTAMAWALAQAKAVAGVKAQTTQYSTHPIYTSNSTAITGWRGRQAVRLEATDSKALGDLIATLQEKLAVESIGFAVSKQARNAAEAALTNQALALFQARAQQVASALGHKSYRVIHINLGTSGEMPQPMVYGNQMMAAKAVAPAQIEAGVQTMTVTASGTIQLESPP